MKPAMDRSDTLLFAIPILLVLGIVLLFSGSTEEEQQAPAPVRVTPEPRPTEVLPTEFQPGSAFKAMPTPGPSDWLAMHHEYGQSFGIGSTLHIFTTLPTKGSTPRFEVVKM